MSDIKRVILFGGQGSSSLFSSQGALAATNDVKSSVAAAILLSKCHAAFLEEVQGLGIARSEVFGDECDFFNSPEKLLAPDATYHDNPIIQGTTICLYQLLRYLANVRGSELEFKSAFQKILETAGFCSGILPAAVVASSRTVQEYVDFGVEAFRLAFWTGYRSTLYCQKILGRRWKELPWSLVVMGLNEDQMLAKVEDFHNQSKSKRLSIAAISGELCITVSGPGPDLTAFKAHCSTASSIRFAHVHALYHGGKQLQSVVEEVSDDLKVRKIMFPSFANLQKPLRSTLDGTFLALDKGEKYTFVERILRLLLVHPVDWKVTSKKISNSALDSLDHNSTTAVEMLSFGPSSNFLLSEIRKRQQNPRMQIVDLSSSTFSPNPLLSDTNDAIAIVGMAVNYPKGKGADALWETLSKGLSAVEEIPDSRFELSQFYDPEGSQSKARKMATRHGNFIEGAWSFDNAFFNISPREAKSMDPQQRLLLHIAQAAMEDAGYAEDTTPTFQKTSFGCYIGVATGDYTDNLRNNIDVYYSPGTLRAFLSGKISYNFKMSGPSIVVDTACSSSLVAISQACRALQNGDCSAAIAGGVNLICSPDMYLGLSRAHFLSPTGQCKSFDEAADGYSRAEGCGLFVLKRLSDAVAENDRIHGIIKGVAINQSGGAHSITHPHAATQADLFECLLKRAHVEPESISVVEAHGTGTQAGDFSEISSLHSVFAKSRAANNPLIVSSIKGNIGHCEAASGSAGLAKLLLMLRWRTIPIQASLSEVNPRLSSLIGDGITVSRRTQEWKSFSALPRRALLNNFGAAGSNVALLLEEYVDLRLREDVGCSRTAYPFNVSARSPWALQELVQQYQRFLKVKDPQIDIRDICYTATARRQIYEHRSSFTCTSAEDLSEQLETANLDISKDDKLSKSIVFVFSGQGSSYLGMGKELMETSTLFKNIVKTCDEVIQNLGFPSVIQLLQSKDNNSISMEENDQVVAFQCACVIVEYALARLWMSWNVLPDIVLGHSLGEYAALAISGVISLEDTLGVVANRAKLMTTNCLARSSGMLACKFSATQAEEILLQSSQFPDLTVACLNSVRDCVVAGPLAQLEAFESHCLSAGHKATKLSVPYGFHSAAMNPIVRPLERLGQSVKFSEPSIPITSNVFGRLMTLEDLDASYFAKHARQPVRFAESIQHLQAQGPLDATLFLEIGPHPITLPMIRATISTNSCTYLPSLHKDREAWSSISASLRQLFLLKDGIEWRQVFDGTKAKLVDLPGHPLSTAETCVAYQESDSSSIRKELPTSDTRTRYTLLPKVLKSKSTQDSYCFETHLFTLARYICGHAVGGIPMCPASVFHELVLEAAQSVLQLSKDAVYVVRDMIFANPMVYNLANEHQPIHVFLAKASSTTDMEFRIVSQSHGLSPETLHCSGTVSTEKVSQMKNDWARKTALVKRQQAHLFTGNGNDLNNFQTKMLYETVFSRVVEYSADYQTLMSLSVSKSSGEGYGSFRIPGCSQMENCIALPTFTDTLLHAAGFVANTNIRTLDACICAKVESIQLFYGDIDYYETFTVYCSLFDSDEGTILADACALDSTGRVIATAEGMHFKKVRLSAFKALLERTTERSAVDKHSSPSQTSPASSGSRALVASPNGTTTPTEEHPHQQSIKTKVSQIIIETCGIPENQMHAIKDLSALGVDSLMTLELVSALKQAFPNQMVDQSSLMHCRNVQDLENIILSTSGTSKDQSKIDSIDILKENRVPSDDVRTNQTQTSGDFDRLANHSVRQTFEEPGAEKPSQIRTALNKESLPVVLRKCELESMPLYLFHDGSGLCNIYSHLHDLGRNMYGFFNPGFIDERDQALTLVEMAARYASLISISATSPIILGGWSFGGVLAFEAARQLSDAGKQVKGVILIDSPHPVGHEPLPDAIIAHVVKSASMNGAGNAARQNIITQFQTNAALLGNYKAPQKGIPNAKVVMLRSQDVFDCGTICGVRYPWLSDQEVRWDAIAAWEKLVGHNIQVLDIPGNHFQAFATQNVTETSKQLRRACELIEETR